MLDATLDADIDDDVTFTFEVTNTGLEPVELTFRTGKTADVSVMSDDETIWRWGEDRLFTQAIRHRTLKSGESLEQQFTWRDPSVGTYLARGSLETEHGVTAETQFTTGEFEE